MLRGRAIGLRPLRRADVETLYEMDADAEHVALADGRPYRPRSLAGKQAEHDEQETGQQPDSVFFAIQRLDDEDGTAIGRVGLWDIDPFHRTAHIGISLLGSARGHGLGRDALDAICVFGFRHRGLERLQIDTLEVNAPMRAISLACGFVEEGRLRSNAWYLGSRADEIIYGQLFSEWQSRRA
ncbi:GNAT family N-acetyltransferase [Cryptosporangium phraense]|uniref:GNAT family N-acetyltransferase n=1 Tax=Cryptosporangium phraense TaxID=2593070 RepID=A0A545AX24_9ACTN|nr:GNAT family protein [Cryptosporangium phraense]TQS45870.1 GNAT family N-acetyltransferase [Cryptosporangium phraense]